MKPTWERGNVRLTAELQGERDDLAEKCKEYGDALVEETKLTSRIAALEEQVRKLTAENERLTNDAIKELIDSAAVREFSYHHQGDNIEARAVIQSPLMGLIGGWITGDFKRTSAVNFLEQELMFTARDGDHRYTVNIRKSGGKTEAQVCGELRAELAERNAYAERLLAENVRLTNEAATERERCGVLEREVRAYREWQRTKCDDNASSLDHWHACKALDAATFETDTRHALDAAKFGKEQNDG